MAAVPDFVAPISDKHVTALCNTACASPYSMPYPPPTEATMLTRAQRKRARTELPLPNTKRPRIHSRKPLRAMLTDDALAHIFDAMDPIAAVRLAQTCTMAWAVWRERYRWLDAAMIVFQSVVTVPDDMLPIGALRRVYLSGTVPACLDPLGKITACQHFDAVIAHRYHSGLVINDAPDSHPNIMAVLTLLLHRMTGKERLDFFCKFAAGKAYAVFPKVVQDIFRVAVHRQLFADMSVQNIRDVLNALPSTAVWDLSKTAVLHMLHVELCYLIAECNAMAASTVMLVLLQQIDSRHDVLERMRFYVRRAVRLNNISFVLQLCHGLRFVYAASSVRVMVAELAAEWATLSAARLSPVAYTSDMCAFMRYFASGVSLWTVPRQARIIYSLSEAIEANKGANFVEAIPELAPMWFERIVESGCLELVQNM